MRPFSRSGEAEERCQALTCFLSDQAASQRLAPSVAWDAGPTARRVNLDTVTRADLIEWQPGETVLLSGKMLTGRDAAHNRVVELFANGQGLPHGVDLNGEFIYYVGPVDPVRDEMIGSTGPTTATRIDKFTEMILEKTGLLDMIGKAEREPAGIEATKSISRRI